METPIPLIDVLAHREIIGDKIDKRIAEVVAHGKWIMGPEVAELENELSEFVGAGVHTISCSNGTDALVLAMQALGVQPGDAIICPAFTFVATAEAAAFLGAHPIFADVEPSGYNLDHESVLPAANVAKRNGLNVVGICAVDLFGVPADYPGLQAVAEELNCWILADAAQSFGGSRADDMVGSLAEVTTTSFFPAKPLGCYGDGGAVFTRSSDIADELRSLRVHGKGSHKYENVRIGQNSRLDTLQAAILLPKLGLLHDEIKMRQRVADRYSQGLMGHVGLPEVPAKTSSAWAQYTIVTDARDHAIEALTNAGIGSAIYYPKPLHLQVGYRHYHDDNINLDRTEWLSSRVLSLPMHPYLADAAIDRTIQVITDCSS